jgi:Ca2+-transporting ATPase
MIQGPDKKSYRSEKKRESEFSPHSFSPQDLVKKFDVRVSFGLSNEEADLRFRRDGPNRIEQKKQRTIWYIIRDQFSSIVVWLLAFAALVALLSGNQLESLAIIVVLILNAAIGLAIEWKAGRALEALRKATKTNVRVRRNGHERIINAENLVIGDILILSAGDRVPADVRILESANLRSDESTLTGESLAVEKNPAPVATDTPLAERRSMLYLGTTVVAGNALVIVTGTGKKTELGNIGRMVTEFEEVQTPLQRKLTGLGRRLVYIVLGIALIVLVAGLIRGDAFWLMLEVSISLAVAAVPEGLPAVTTLILALGVLRMARRNAIVRRLAAVETLGSSTVICTDKTGTLTENQMTVQEYRLANEKTIRISDGKVFEKDEILKDENLIRLLRVSVLCNEAVYESDKAEQPPEAIGDPTETALLRAFEQFGFKVRKEKSKFQKLLEFPFDSSTKRMITILKDKNDHSIAVMKGAPSVILKVCDDYVTEDNKTALLNDKIRKNFLRINRGMAGDALRVLAFADKQLPGALRRRRKIISVGVILFWGLWE